MSVFNEDFGASIPSLSLTLNPAFKRETCERLPCVYPASLSPSVRGKVPLTLIRPIQKNPDPPTAVFLRRKIDGDIFMAVIV